MAPERGFVSLWFTASVRETCTAVSVLSADLANLLGYILLTVEH